jgi:hypothetical protein
MKKIILSSIVAASSLLSSFAFAQGHGGAPVGNGNFRRAEVLQKLNANPKTTYVMGIATANSRVAPANLPRDARILAVAMLSGKVHLMKAPLDKSKPVTRLSTREANEMGLVTQAQARKQAEHNGGKLGNEHHGVRVTALGLTPNGASYQFRQTSHVALPGPAMNEVTTDIRRSVTLTGAGESAYVAGSAAGAGAPRPSP